MSEPHAEGLGTWPASTGLREGPNEQVVGGAIELAPLAALLFAEVGRG